jgi:hypothetical protein
MLFHERSHFREKFVNAVSGGLLITRAIVEWLGRDPCGEFNPENMSRNCIGRLRLEREDTFAPVSSENATA